MLSQELLGAQDIICKLDSIMSTHGRKTTEGVPALLGDEVDNLLQEREFKW